MSGDDPIHLARLLAERRASWYDLHARRLKLGERLDASERELAALDREHARLQPVLPASVVGFDWGGLPALTPTAAERVACQRELLRQCLVPEISGDAGPRLEIISEPETVPLSGGVAATVLVADESLAENLRQLPAVHFALVLLPHILNLLPCPRSLLFACRRVLRHGGLLLATLPGPAAPQCADAEQDRRRYTPGSAARLLGDYFPARELEISAAGGMADAVAAWYGLTGRVWAGDPASAMPLFILARTRKP